MTPDHNDKILDHHRLQLSALIDGELAPDEARFLLRRLEHETELAGCWERWQLCGDVLRGQVHVHLPDGFATRVADAVAAEAGSPALATRRRRLGWAGGALAAAVAVVALMTGRQSPDPRPTAPPPLAAAPSRADGPVRPAQPAMPATPKPAAPDTASELAAAVAVAEVPRRAVARHSRGQSQRAVVAAATRAEVPGALAANAATSTAPVDPFATVHPDIQTRPWPRALVPGSPAGGAFTVEYGERPSSFYPFEPRMQPPLPEESDRGP